MTQPVYEAPGGIEAFGPSPIELGIALLNRWGSLRYVSHGLARACGWFWKPKPIVQVTAAWDPSGITWHEVRR